MNGIEIKDVKFVHVNKWGFSFDINLGENELPMINRSEITPRINKEHVTLEFYAMGKESHDGLEHDMNIEIHMTYKEFEELALNKSPPLCFIKPGLRLICSKSFFINF